jgi:c(7)-type cytochrome triheme protein
MTTTTMGISLVAALLAALLAPLCLPTDARAQTGGKAIYDAACAACHGTGLLGAPKPGDAAAWGARAKGGIDGLVKSALAGTAKGMPPKGGRADLSTEQIRSAIEYMTAGALPAARAAAAPKAAVAAAAPAGPAAAAPATPPTTPPTAAPAAAPVARTPPSSPPPPAAAAEPSAPTAAAAPAPAAAAAPTPTPTPSTAAIASAEVNAFNRLLKPLGRINRPAVDSGIHDPANDMTLQLQPPALAFAPMPKSTAGNHVDWVKALDAKSIAPRWDRNDAAAAAIVMDLNIVREVKGSMPDVVYPHKQHTEWLDCSNCHPAIFVPQKGANQISMASILLGQKCGVCHGKVAFPVSECRLCHSRKKAVATVAGETKP